MPDYLCPLCRQLLSRDANSLSCPNRHQFDYAKEGYVNLLPVQHKKSLKPGDDKQMVMARREFLRLGYYEFLRDALNQQLQTCLTCNQPTLVDLGCGEGYYTDGLQQQNPNATVYGIDVSKTAVKYAAKQNKQIHYSVGTNALLPFADHSIDAMTNVFAPVVMSEISRALKSDGQFITVNPGPRHLFELKQQIYTDVKLHTPIATPAGFKLVHQEPLEQQVSLSEATEIEALLQMTPFFWKASVAQKTALLENTPFTVTLSFDLRVFAPGN